VFDTLLSLSEQFAGAVKLDAGACLNGKHKDQFCTYCADVCPVDAITLTGDVFSPIEMDGTRCVRCGACVPACPTNAFSQPRQEEEQANVSKMLEDFRSVPVELTCPQHPGDDRSKAPAEAAVDVGRCLGSLSLSRLLAWTTSRKADVWLNDELCSDCPIGDLRDWISTEVNAANGFLSAWGREERIHLVSELGKRKERRVPFYDGQQPGFSRREFFSALGRMMFRAVGTMVEEALPVPLPASEGDVPPERLRLRAVVAGMGTPVEDTVDLKGLPFGNVSVGDACSGCDLCVRICPTDALTSVVDGDRYTLRFIEADCFGCDLCATVCPERAVEVGSVVDTHAFVSDEPKTLVEGTIVPCEGCGAPVLKKQGEKPLCHICKLKRASRFGEIYSMIDELKGLREGGKPASEGEESGLSG